MSQPVRPEDRFFLLFEGLPPPVTALWGFQIEGGTLDEPRMLEALAWTLEHHPKAASRIASKAPLRWEPCPEANTRALFVHPPFERPTETACSEWMNLPLSAATGPLVQLHWQVHSPSRATLGFRFHHALADGLGALVFLRDLLARYQGEASPTAPPPIQLQPLAPWPWREKLRLFGKLSAFHWRRARRHGLSPAAKLFPLARKSSGTLGSIAATIEGERLDRWLRRAKELQVSLNDLLLAGIGLGLGRWRESKGLPEGSLRIMVNQNLRARSQPLALENRSSAFPVWITTQDRSRPDELATLIHRQVVECQEQRIAEGIALFSGILKLPLPLAKKLILPAAAKPQLADSFILSNLGRVESFRLGTGTSTLVQSYVRPPDGVGALCLVSTMNQRLTLNWCFLEGLLEKTEVAAAMEAVGQALDELSFGPISSIQSCLA